MWRIRIAALLGLVTLALAVALPSQAPFKSNNSLPAHSLREIDSWALNPTGDAAVIRVKTSEKGQSKHELHLLAINAQFTVPSVLYGSAADQSVYTFLNDQTFLTISPANDGQWELFVQDLNYTTLPPAYPPSASPCDSIGKIASSSKITQAVYAAQADILALHTEFKEVILVKLVGGKDEWMVQTQLVPRPYSHPEVEDLTTNGTHLLDSTVSIWEGGSSSSIILLNLQDVSLPQHIVAQASDVILSAPAFEGNHDIAWLSQKKSENRKLWVFNNEAKWEVALNFDRSPEKIIFSKDGKAIYLLTPHSHEQSLYHLWTPSFNDVTSIKPVRIPSNGTIHSAIHVGITPLDHAHLIGVKSDTLKNEGTELWVISHSPHEDPTYNYENIRLTYFTG
ncbi:uncharacterized protein L201_008111 [Kwoniella dendrophila CBS 6074]|uniref:Uncharacterized protein n=1 Tax=Kwoniella dendrophila CBS 6074 TaxID=1295534 RepID=A0AAX4K7N1_9TREE